MSIYVEITIRSPIEDLWSRTQTPDLHQRWDLRFTQIEYLPRNNEAEPQRFLYTTRIGFGIHIAGEGESTGSRDSDNGSRVSALKFWSNDPKSLIRQGSGYWKYIPGENGVKFLTWYDYSTRFGAAGRAVDAICFRPLMRWATAWSFDRLRLWIEQGIDPSVALQQSLIHALSRLGIAFVWIYHGLVPKLIVHHRDEIAMLAAQGFQPDQLPIALKVVGWGEVAFGLLFLIPWRAEKLLLVNIIVMICALVDVAINSPDYLVAAFNPVTLNITVIVLSMIGYIAGRNMPSARRCITKQETE